MASTEQLLAQSFSRHYDALLNDEYLKKHYNTVLGFELLPAMAWIAFDSARRAGQDANKAIAPVYQEIFVRLNHADGDKYSSRLNLYRDAIKETDFRIEWMPQRDEDNYLFGGSEELVVQVIWLLTDLLVYPSCADHYFDFDTPSLMEQYDPDDQVRKSTFFRSFVLDRIGKDLFAFSYDVYELLRKDSPEPVVAVFQKYYYRATMRTTNCAWYSTIREELVPFMFAVVLRLNNYSEPTESFVREILSLIQGKPIHAHFNDRVKFYIANKSKPRHEWGEFKRINELCKNEELLISYYYIRWHSFVDLYLERKLKEGERLSYYMFSALADLLFNPACAENYENAPALIESMDEKKWARKASRFLGYAYMPLFDEMLEYTNELLNLV